MLTIYHSNQLDLLKSLLAALIEQQPNANIFEPETILVQSPGMAQWLQLQLAEHFSIAANIEFLLPARFIWRLFNLVLEDVPAEHAFSKQAMTWKLMSLLPQFHDHPAFASLHHYLGESLDVDGYQDEYVIRKHHQLAARIADLFDQYLVYRPDWIYQWQQQKEIKELGEDGRWQGILWRALTDYTEQLNQSHWHRANLHEDVIKRLQQPTPIKGLPKRLFICGVSALPGSSLAVFHALGQHCDVHLLNTNPCRWYWGDIKDQHWLAMLLKRKRRYFYQQGESDFFKQPQHAKWLYDAFGQLEEGNSLLASWGKLGRDYLYLLQDLGEVAQIDAFVDIEGDTILATLQRDILNLEDGGGSANRQPFINGDGSFSLHICHSEMREIEVLQDHLLDLFEQDRTLTPRDVIVMVADIDHYAPYIRSVFGDAQQDCFLPYAISDRKMKQLDPIIQCFLTLLALPHSRFNAEDILALLDVSALAQQFAIDERELVLLHRWVVESGIRWGLDDHHLFDLSLPSIGQNTWQFGLMRMLLGYAQDSRSGVFQGILPYDETRGLIGELVGKLAKFVVELQRWRQRLQQSYNGQDWLGIGRELLSTWFAHNEQTTAVLLFIEQRWAEVLQQVIESQYPQCVPLTVLRDEMGQCLDQSYMSQRFLAGQINFCTLMPMRSIPFKVVCLLGMNDGVYPRQQLPISFDLMLKQSRRGDRSRRDDDRYLFLEALLSAQQQFYLSYIGYSIQDNSDRYPSLLVNELLDYIGQRFMVSTSSDPTAHVSPSDAQRVIDAVTVRHSRVPFSPSNFITGSAQQSYAKQWLPVAQRKIERAAVFGTKLASLTGEYVNIDDLRRFYRHPLRAFFQQRLGVYFQQDQMELLHYEPFDLEGLTRYQLNQMLLNQWIDSPFTEESLTTIQQAMYTRSRAAGLLPYGVLGEIIWQQQCDDVRELAEKVHIQRQQTYSVEVDIQLAQDNMYLSGWLHHVQDDGLLRWRPGELTIVDGLTLWVDHVIYSALGGKGESRMYGKGKVYWRFMPLEEQTAFQYLRQFLRGYRHGLNRPHFFLPIPAWEWLSRVYEPQSDRRKVDPNVQNKALRALVARFESNQYGRNEYDDPYVRRVIQTLPLTPATIRKIQYWGRYYLLPLWRHLLVE